MATNNRKSVIETQAVESKAPEVDSHAVKTKEEPKVQESTYTAAELAAAHKTFGTSYEIVATAMKLSGKERATAKEAKEIIENFKNKEVK